MNSMAGRVILTLLASGVFIVASRPAHPLRAGEALTLKECIDIALRNNPDIGIAEEGLRNAESGLLADYGMLLPNFSISFQSGHAFFGPSSSIQFDTQGRPVQYDGFDYESYSFDMTSYLTLWDGSGNINRIRSSLRSRDAVREDYRYSKDMILAEVIRVYYNLVRNRMLLYVAQESLDQSLRNLERAEILLEVGSATRADVLKARVLHSNNKYNIIQARNAVELSREDLVAVLNMHEERSFAVDTSLVITYVDIDVDREIGFASANRPDLKSREYSIMSAKADIAAARSGYLPRLDAGFNYRWNNREMADNLNFFQNEYSWTIGASLSFNVFDRFATSSSVKSAKANKRIAEYNLEKAKLGAVKEIKSLVFLIKEAREMIAVSEETVEQAMEDFRLAEERYRVGAGTMLETIDAQVALTQAKANVIDAKCNYLIAVADLGRATGRGISHD